MPPYQEILPQIPPVIGDKLKILSQRVGAEILEGWELKDGRFPGGWTFVLGGARSVAYDGDGNFLITEAFPPISDPVWDVSVCDHSFEGT